MFNFYTCDDYLPNINHKFKKQNFHKITSCLWRLMFCHFTLYGLIRASGEPAGLRRCMTT